MVSIKNRYDDVSVFLKKAEHLATIHKSPPAAWPALVDSLIKQGWSVKETENKSPS